MTDNKHCDGRQLILYHYNELEPVDLQLCAEHLEQCPQCHAAFEQIKTGLNALPVAELRLDPAQKKLFSEQVIAGIQARKQWRSKLRGSSLVAAGALAVTIFLIPIVRQPAVSPNPAFADLEIIEQFEFLQNFEVIQDLDLLEALGDMG